ncbi:MAG: PocR ligand-binding domain-containing protein [Desulfococcaceae bacterium]
MNQYKNRDDLINELKMLRKRAAEIEALLGNDEKSAAGVRECSGNPFFSVGGAADETLCFSDLFDMDEIQKIQDAFAKAAGVASMITTPQGKPLTKPSNFCRLCMDIIRKTEKGRINCMRSDAVIGRYNPSGPVIRPCLSGGLWDGGASISAGEHHIANWLIGQVRNEYLDMEKMMQYAREIGADESEFRKALEEVPVMSQNQFMEISQALFLIANLMSQTAYRNLQQKQFITELGHREEMLDFERKRLFSVLEAIPAFVYLQAPDYSVRFANRRFREIFGDPEGRACYEIIQHSDAPCKNCPTFAVFDSHAPQQWEWIDEFRRQIYRIYDNYLPDIDGSPMVLEMGIDITEQKNAETELGCLRNLLAGIVSHMPSMLAGIDSMGRVILWNRESERITGIPAAAAKGRILYDMLPFTPEDRERIQTLIRENRACRLERLVWEKAEGKCFSDVIVYPLSSDNTEVTVIRIDDITEKVRMEEMIIQSEKMISVGGLAAGMAHEINNPLGGILQSVQNIQRRISSLLSVNIQTAAACGTDLDTIRNYLEQRHIFQFLEGIRKSGERAAKIVDNMLRFSRGSGSQMHPVDLAELVDKTVELASHDYDPARRYDFRNIEVIREVDPDLPEVICMATEIEQVLLNLLRNAAQAMFPVQPFLSSESGTGKYSILPRIILRVYREEDSVFMEVEDSGPGMDENTQHRVFEPFFTTKPAECGTGLGLSISYFIITNNHKGTMRVESEPGKGTKFIISLPLKQENVSGSEVRHIASFI